MTFLLATLLLATLLLAAHAAARAPSIKIYSKPVDWFSPFSEFTEINGRPQSKFVDAAPVLIASEQSPADLNSRLL
jgi:hypothetical protein